MSSNGNGITSDLQGEIARLRDENATLQRLLVQHGRAEDNLRLIFNSVYDAIIVHAADGTVVDVNEKMLALYGVSYPQALTFSILDYSDTSNPLDDLPQIWNLVLAGESQFFEWKARRPLDGTIFDVEVFLHRMTLAQKVYILANVRDITERKRMQEALRQSEALLQSFLAYSPAIMFVRDLQGRFLLVNHQYELLAGRSRAQLLGKTSYDVFSAEYAQVGLANDQLVITSGQPVVREETLPTTAGLHRYLAIKFPLFDEQGAVAAVGGITTDIEEQKRAEEELRRHNVYLSSLNDTTLELMHRLEVSDLIERIIRRAGQLLDTSNGFLYLVEPDNAEMEVKIGTGIFRDALGKRLRPGQGVAGTVWRTGQPLEINDYYTWSERVFESAYDPCRCLVGVPLMSGEQVVGVLGLAYTEPDRCFGAEGIRLLSGFARLASIALDNAQLYSSAQQEIAQRKRIEEALQHANEQLKSWVSELEQRNRDISLLNQMADQLHSCQTLAQAYPIAATFIGRLFTEQVGVLYLVNAPGSLDAVITWGRFSSNTQEIPLHRCTALHHQRTGSIQPLQTAICSQCRLCTITATSAPYLCVPLVGEGEPLGILHLRSREPLAAAPHTGIERLAVVVTGQLALAIANLRLRERLRVQSIRDPLTGLFNRRYLDETLARELYEAARQQHPLGIVMLDIDHFKRFNDTYHHDAGDALLRAVGALLQTHIRAADIACRYGGEEFVLILPGAAIEDTYKRAEQLRAEIKQLVITHNNQVLPGITISAGIAVFPLHGITSETLMQAADQALYRAKFAGRDQVIVAELPQQPLEKSMA